MPQAGALRPRDAAGWPVPPRRGFTLIELMVAVAIATILTYLAVPAMGSFIAAQRLRVMATDLYMALQTARSEAVKRNVSVTLDPLSGGWAAGWQLLDPAAPTGNPALDVWASSGSASVTTTPAALAQVVFNANGRLSATSSISFVFSATATSAARCVSIDTSGRPYVKVGTSC